MAPAWGFASRVAKAAKQPAVSPLLIVEFVAPQRSFLFASLTVFGHYLSERLMVEVDGREFRIREVGRGLKIFGASD